MRSLLLATRNPGKVREIESILADSGWSFSSLQAFPDVSTPDETSATYAENAILKARFYAEATGMCALADDSGLEVDALNGAPGVHSARFAALDTGADGNSTDAENSAKLLRLLKHVPLEKRTARFRCVLALAPAAREQNESASPVCYANETELQIELFEGICEGRILVESRGTSGFGYDPLFVPNGFDRTFAELGETEKNQISHRAKALKKLKQRLAAMPHSH